MHATLDFPQLDKLNKRAITARRMREQAEAFSRMAHVVDAHWYEIPYEIRQRLEAEAARFEVEPSRRPQTPLDWLKFIGSGFEMLWAAITGDEDFLVHYAFARANFAVALKNRILQERAADAEAWRSATNSDHGFVAAFQKGTAAANAGGFVEMDWTSPTPTK